MADMKKLGNSVKGRNLHGRGVERLEKIERLYIIGGALVVVAGIILMLFAGFLLPG